jgi:hypothetical protein
MFYFFVHISPQIFLQEWGEMPTAQCYRFSGFNQLKSLNASCEAKMLINPAQE